MGVFKQQNLRESETRQPMCLHHLQEQNLRVFCWCNRCSHNAELEVDLLIERLGALYPVPELGIHLRCSHCNTQDVSTRPPGPAMGDKLPGMASKTHHPNYYNQLIILSVIWTAADGQVRSHVVCYKCKRPQTEKQLR